MNTQKFYAVVRGAFGPLKQQQVDGFNLILNEAVRRKVRLDSLAYILATVWHETAFTMQPIKEMGGERYLKSKKYWPYFGRGYVQLTWEYNYKKASDVFGVDFVKNPDLVMQPKYALPILFVGMEEGWFTGKDLDDYLDGVDEDDKEDLREFSNARRIINGTDKQVEIGKIALVFERALKAGEYKAGTPLETPQKPVEGPKQSEPVSPSPTKPKGFLELLIEFIIGLFGKR